jgi:hypothetical protein
MKDGISNNRKAGCDKSTVAKQRVHDMDRPSTSIVVGSLIMYLVMLTIIIIIAKAIN